MTVRFKEFRIISVGILLISIFSCENQELDTSEVVSLNFKKELISAKSLDSLEKIDIKIISYHPLLIESNEVRAMQLDLEGEIKTIILRKGIFNKLTEKSGYLFNGNTNCFMYGTYITDSDTGHWTFLYATPAVQSVMNVCAGFGGMYAKTIK